MVLNTSLIQCELSTLSYSDNFFPLKRKHVPLILLSWTFLAGVTGVISFVHGAALKHKPASSPSLTGNSAYPRLALAVWNNLN